MARALCRCFAAPASGRGTMKKPSQCRSKGLVPVGAAETRKSCHMRQCQRSTAPPRIGFCFSPQLAPRRSRIKVTPRRRESGALIMNPTEARYVSRLTRETLALVLAGGRGSRLGPLTDWRAKPAVPFGGKFRIIDFPLSNCINSGIRRIAVLTQYKSHSLIRHIQKGWGFPARRVQRVHRTARPRSSGSARPRGTPAPPTRSTRTSISSATTRLATS